jgi:hypothetical protein
MRDISDAELISRALESRIADIHGAMPAIVQAFTAAVPGVQAAAVDVLPVCSRGIPTDDDTLAQEPFPVVPNVPVLYMRGGGVSITFDLVQGDVVLLVPLMLDASQWRSTGAPIVAPNTDQRMHHIAHCVAIPGLIADVAQPIPSPTAALRVAVNGATLTLDGAGAGVATIDAPTIKLGANATHAAADATKVGTELAAIKTALAGASPPIPYTPNPAGVGATKVKVE